MDSATQIHKIQNLLETPEFNELQKIGAELYNEKKEFDLLSVLDELIVENTWSRIFAYLFDSKKEHELKQTALRNWLQYSSESNETVKKFVDSLPNEQESESVTITEWSTPNGRRIDILIKIQDRYGNTKAVIGIENKVDSSEQVEQLSDYQAALIESFTAIPKIMFFLTPDGRLSQTAVGLQECPCVCHPYNSMVHVCDKLIPITSGQLNLFLQALKKHISKLTINNNNSMENSIKELIHKLYENSEYRHAIKLIREYSPSINNVFDGLRETFEGSSVKSLNLPIQDNGIEVRTYLCKEFQVHINELNDISAKKGIYPCYMLLCKEVNPDIGDEFVLRLMLLYEKLQGIDVKMKEKLRNGILELSELPNSMGQKLHSWRWVNIWVGESYKLVDLGKKDIEGMTSLLCKGINETIEPLKQKLLILSKSKGMP